jgi:hypothetical protein
MIQDRFVAFAHLHGVTIKQNPRLDYEDAKQRVEPDVIFYPGVHEDVQTDITVINPCAPHRMKGGAHNGQPKVRRRGKGASTLPTRELEATFSARLCSKHTGKCLKKSDSPWTCWPLARRWIEEWLFMT